MSGVKQFFIKILNIIFTYITMTILFFILNLVFLDSLGDTREKMLLFNFILFLFFVVYLLIQNIWWKSFFYKLIKCELITNIYLKKMRIFISNLILNFIMGGMIFTQVINTKYFLKYIYIILFIIEMLPCFITKYKKSLSSVLLKIDIKKVDDK